MGVLFFDLLYWPRSESVCVSHVINSLGRMPFVPDYPSNFLTVILRTSLLSDKTNRTGQQNDLDVHHSPTI